MTAGSGCPTSTPTRCSRSAPRGDRAGRAGARRPAERPRVVAVGRAARGRHDVAGRSGGWMPRGRCTCTPTCRRSRRELQRHGRRTDGATRTSGNFGFDIETPSRGTDGADLALVRPDGTVEVAAADVRFPNGSVDHAGRRDADRRRVDGRALHGLHDRGRRDARRPPGVGRGARDGARRVRARRRGRHLDGRRRRRRAACGC